MDIETMVGWGIIGLFFIILFFQVKFRVSENKRIQEIVEKEKQS